jgi:hypothetical protein
MPSALKSEHPTLHSMKFLNFFYFLWVIFALLDPDRADQNQSGPYPDRIQIHNTALLQVKGLPLASSGDGGNCNKNHDLLTYSKPMTWDGFFFTLNALTSGARRKSRAMGSPPAVTSLFVNALSL